MELGLPVLGPQSISSHHFKRSGEMTTFDFKPPDTARLLHLFTR